MTNGLDCEVMVMVFWTYLLNVFTVPDDDNVSDLCLASI